jgi:hypothetical protein
MGVVRSRVVGLCVLFILALGALASNAWAGACATYLSSGENDEPMSGTLRGSQTVTESWTVTGTVTGGSSWLSGGGSGTYTKTVEYEVGLYEFEGGGLQYLDCRDYTYYNG